MKLPVQGRFAGFWSLVFVLVLASAVMSIVTFLCEISALVYWHYGNYVPIEGVNPLVIVMSFFVMVYRKLAEFPVSDFIAMLVMAGFICAIIGFVFLAKRRLTKGIAIAAKIYLVVTAFVMFFQYYIFMTCNPPLSSLGDMTRIDSRPYYIFSALLIFLLIMISWAADRALKRLLPSGKIIGTVRPKN
jgi:hypothetical protein